MTASPCIFCNFDPERIWMQNEIGIAILDAFPVTEGHVLVIPRKHVESLFDLTLVEQAALWRFVGDVRGYLLQELHPDGFNIGVNDGKAAGQTVMHAHIHVIPRRMDDDPDPRGGIRRVIAKKARYWEKG
jgi:diadenosine tetraphosphate (Ap4A) HIT family hydrolase